ncbi:MAG: hypothetical protein AB1491_05025 [Thermodesulfobacteriota bacterium]
MWLGILAFAAGVLVGYKYPQQVEQALTSTKKLYQDLKDKISKKETPPSA